MNHTITGTTAVVGVLGYPVKHSLSPLMHNAAFVAMGLDWVYVPFSVSPASLADAVRGAAALGIRGLNVTIPHKNAVIPFLDQLTPEATAVASVNTIALTAHGLIGHSTDGVGFLRALTVRGFAVPGTHAVILGAGGASRAVVGALAAQGAARITVIARHPERAAALHALAEQLAPGMIDFRAIPWDDAARHAIADAQLVVNATPIGMAPQAKERMPIPAEWLSAATWVYDLVYTPAPTAWLHAAAERGCQTIDGLDMLVYQGAEALTFWTQQPAPIAVMRAALAAYLQQAQARAVGS